MLGGFGHARYGAFLLRWEIATRGLQPNRVCLPASPRHHDLTACCKAATRSCCDSRDFVDFNQEFPPDFNIYRDPDLS